MLCLVCSVYNMWAATYTVYMYGKRDVLCQRKDWLKKKTLNTKFYSKLSSKNTVWNKNDLEKKWLYSNSLVLIIIIIIIVCTALAEHICNPEHNFFFFFFSPQWWSSQKLSLLGQHQKLCANFTNMQAIVHKCSLLHPEITPRQVM